LNFGAIKFEYKPQAAKGGNVEFEWKVEEGESNETGPIITENDDGSTTVEYCVYEEVHEVGVFEEVCYEIEIPEGCTLTSSEAGVYKIECEEDEVVLLNPMLEGLPAVDIVAPEGGGLPLIGLLLPAVQD
jgi:hypothetical protein